MVRLIKGTIVLMLIAWLLLPSRAAQALAASAVPGTGYALTDFATGFPYGLRDNTGLTGLAFDSVGNLYVMDLGSGGYLYKFGPEGGVADATHMLPWKMGWTPVGLAFSNLGLLYYADQSTGVVERTDVLNGGDTGAGFAMNWARSIVVDPATNDMYVAQWNGPIFRVYGYEGCCGSTVSQFTPPWFGGSDAIAMAPDRTMYIIAHDSDIYRVDGPNGSAPGNPTYITSVPNAGGIAVAPNSNPAAPPALFVNRYDGVITKIDLATNPVTTTDIVTGGSVGILEAIGPDGCLYATQTDRILRVSRDDGSCVLAGGSLAPISGTTPGFPASPYPYAGTAITVDPYPPTQGQQTTLGALLQNPTASPVLLDSVDFAVSGYGMGLTWQSVGSKTNVTIPAGNATNPGTAHPTIAWSPPVSGHHCVQVTLHFHDGHTQTLQRNIDILGLNGDASAGFSVGNPTQNQASVTLKIVKVAESPTGWTAALDHDSLTLDPAQVFAGVHLAITPPSGAQPGDYATFNVEAYIGDTLIGGISKTVVIGSTLPPPVLTSPTPGSSITGSNTTLTGTSLPLALIQVTVGGQTDSTVADASGNWSLSASLGDGSQTLLITQTVGGTTSAPAGGPGGITILVGQLAKPTIGLAPGSDSGTVGDNLTNVVTPTLRGTADSGRTVTISDGSSVLGTAIADSSGAWTFTPTSALGDGSHTITASVSNGTQTSTSDPLTVKIDTAPPSLTIVSGPKDPTNSTAASFTFSSGDASATFTCALDSGNPAACSSPASYTVAANTVHQLLITATDPAGNSTTGSYTWTVDTTAPTGVQAAAGRAPDANGWYNHAFTVTWSGQDALSGVANCTQTTYSGPDTATGSISGTCTDKAGNVSEPVAFPFKYDATGPALTPTFSSSPIVLNSTTSVSPGASDGVSGVATASCGPVDTSAVGNKTLPCTATDLAGNTTTTTVSYNVLYAPSNASCGTIPGRIALQPINPDGSSVFKVGSTVSVKFRVYDAKCASIGTLGVVTSFVLLKTSADPGVIVNETVDSSTPDTAFRWDATGQQWVFNISTKGKTSNAMYYYRITLNDGTFIDFNFALR